MLNTCLKSVRRQTRAGPLEKMYLVVEMPVYRCILQHVNVSAIPVANGINNTDTTLITTYL
jgi:hypothetical protein